MKDEAKVSAKMELAKFEEATRTKTGPGGYKVFLVPEAKATHLAALRVLAVVEEAASLRAWTERLAADPVWVPMHPSLGLVHFLRSLSRAVEG